MRAAFGDFVDDLHGHAGGFDGGSGAARGHEGKVQGVQIARDFYGGGFVAVFDGEEDFARGRAVGLEGARQALAGADLGLDVGLAKGLNL